MNIAIINNSNNPDMAIYFEAKKNINSKKLTFAANTFYCDEDLVHLSSISPKNKLSWHFFVDCLIGVFLGIKLKLKGIDCLLFDTAHISNIPLAFVAKCLSLKLVFTIHDWSPHDGNMARATRLYNRIVEKFLAHHFVVFSPIETNVPHTVLDLSGFTPNFNETKPLGQSFLFFGRMQPYKGLHNLIQISEKLKLEMPNAIINVMGAGSDSAIETLLQLPNINVVNEFISEDDLNSELRKTSGVILPYNSATQSGVIIKSFSMGVPVIAYDVGALNCYVEDGRDGFLVGHGDVEGFVNAMKEICINFQTFSNRVKINFEKYYSDKALISQYEQLIVNLGENIE